MGKTSRKKWGRMRIQHDTTHYDLAAMIDLPAALRSKNSSWSATAAKANFQEAFIETQIWRSIGITMMLGFVDHIISYYFCLLIFQKFLNTFSGLSPGSTMFPPLSSRVRACTPGTGASQPPTGWGSEPARQRRRGKWGTLGGVPVPLPSKNHVFLMEIHQKSHRPVDLKHPPNGPKDVEFPWCSMNFLLNRGV